MERLINWSDLTDAERGAAKTAAGRSIALLESIDRSDIDMMALLVDDDHPNYSMSIVYNSRAVVESVMGGKGVPKLEARWLYEHWTGLAQHTVLPAEANPTKDLATYFSIGVEAVRIVRGQMPDMAQILFVVDDNHEYDGLVMDAVAAANPDGQAKVWLKNPPPDCFPQTLE